MRCISKNCPFKNVNADNCHFFAGCDFARPQPTNGDRIRAMTDEELADFLEAVTNACFERSNPRCPNCPMKIKGSAFCDIDGWLKQPAKGEA